MRVKKQILETHTVTRDSEGNQREVTTSKAYTVKTEGEGFYLTFFENLSGFFKLTSATDIKLLAFLCSRAGFETGKVTLGSKLRDDICSELKIHNSQISRSVKNLVSKNLIHQVKDELEINPVAFWKGSTEARSKLLKDKSIELKLKFSLEVKE